MGAYMYPIIIKREPQFVRYNRKVELETDILTKDLINKNVSDDEIFSIQEEYNSQFPTFYLSISSKRLETEKEFEERLNRQEEYMIEYNKRHNL